MFRLVDRVRRSATVLGVLVMLTGVVAVGSGVLARRALEASSQRARDAAAARSLGALGRAQYIDELHRARGTGGAHPPEEPWAARMSRGAARLAPALDADSRGRLARIEQRSRALSLVLGPREAGEPSPDDEHAAQAIVEALVEDADRLAERLERRASDAEASALQASRAAVFLGGLFSGLGVVFAWLVGRRLLAEVSTPVSRLRAVTERVRAGERAARVGPLDAAELHDVGAGLDAMLDALDEADARLHAAEKLAVLGRVAATVAHEMNNPLAVLRGTVASLAEGASSDELRRELAVVDDEARACQRIVEDLRLASHAPLLRLEQLDPSTLARDLVERRAMGARLVVDVAADTVVADGLRLRQVLDNLLDNAEQSTQRRGHVNLSGRRVGDSYELVVDDDGPGVPAPDRARIFEPFVSGRGGSGLGLAVCRAIAHAHGGTLSVGDAEVGGARFTLRVPVDGPRDA